MSDDIRVGEPGWAKRFLDEAPELREYINEELQRLFAERLWSEEHKPEIERTFTESTKVQHTTKPWERLTHFELDPDKIKQLYFIVKNYQAGDTLCFRQRPDGDGWILIRDSGMERPQARGDTED